MPFLRMQMEQLGATHVLQLSQDANQVFHAMPIEWTKVANVHPFEDILLMRYSALQRVTQSDQPILPIIMQHAMALHPSGGFEAHLVVGLVCAQAQQVLLHATHRTVDRHVIIVQDDKDIVRTGRHIVQALKGQAATHGTIANDGHHLPVFVLQLGGHGHAQCGRNTIGGMATDKRIIGTFLGRGKGAQPMQLAIRGELLAAASQDLMSISLMAHIPYDAVVGGVKHIVQCNRQLNNPQTGRQMSRVHRQFLHNRLAQLVADLRQLLNRQLPQIVGVIYLFKYLKIILFHN